MSTLRRILPLPLIALLAACGNSSGTLHESAGLAAAGEVAVSGHISAPGTKGPLLVFALAGDAGDPSARDTLSVAAVDAQGDFALTMPPAEVVSFAFLADGANDGAIDGGDPVALLTGPALANLGGGEVVILTDLALDFGAHKATAAAIDVQRPGAGAAAAATFTPTAVPAENAAQ